MGGGMGYEITAILAELMLTFFEVSQLDGTRSGPDSTESLQRKQYQPWRYLRSNNYILPFAKYLNV